MASHHHHCHQPPPIPNAIYTSTTCYCTTPTPTPPPPSLDPHLLQSLISILQSQNPNPNSPCHCNPIPHPNHQNPHQIYLKDRIFTTQNPTHNSLTQQAVLASLVNRIDALESTLKRRDYDFCVYGFSKVKEAAARVIQFHFRKYLVSRSRSLRHLKDLAFIKSRFNVIKLSVSDHGRFDPVGVSSRIVDLLYKVDSIQDHDTMIVNGKKALARDLVGFLDYIDVIAVKRHVLLSRAVKKVSVVQTRGDRENLRGLGSDLRGVGRERRAVVESLRGQVVDEDEDDEDEDLIYAAPCVIKKKGFGIGNGSLGDKQKPQVERKKNVSFADNGRNRNVIRIHEPNSKASAESCNNSDVKGILESLRKRVEEMEAGLANGAQADEEEKSESGGSAQTSDGENCGTSSAVETDNKSMHKYPTDEDEDEEFTFPAPEHNKMDSRGAYANTNLNIKS